LAATRIDHATARATRRHHDGIDRATDPASCGPAPGGTSVVDLDSASRPVFSLVRQGTAERDHQMKPGRSDPRVAHARSGRSRKTRRVDRTR
jgi:hypothetical protein